SCRGTSVISCVASGRGVRRAIILLLLCLSASCCFQATPIVKSSLPFSQNLGWQTRLEKDLLQSREVGSGILAKAQLLATGLPPRGELLTHRVPCLRIFQRQCAR